MSLHNPLAYWQTLRASASTGTVTNSDENLAFPINYQFKGCLVTVSRTAETGTCTLAWKIQFYSPAAATWQDLEGAVGDGFADGETGDRYLMVYPGLVGSDADNKITLNTDQAVLCGSYLPRECRLVVTTGGTSVANTYSAEVQFLP